jgi:Tol biopolymer transport system component
VMGLNEGDTPRSLTADNRILFAAWSPDGKTIVYTNNTGIFTIKTDGSGPPVQIVKNASDPDWSPDGTKIAYVSLGAIYISAADGSNAVKVVTGTDPTWSPDGTRLSYLTNGALFTIKPDGTENQQLTRSGSGASWSP